MKTVRFFSAGVLLLLLGGVAPSYAQQEEAKPPKQEQAKPEKKQQDKAPKQQPQAKGQQQQQKQQQQAQGQQQQQQRAQQQQQNQNKQQQQQRVRQQQQAKGQQQQKQQQQAQGQQQKQQRVQQQQQAQGRQQASQHGQRVQQGQQREVWQQHRATNWQSQHRDWQQRGGYNGYRIPDDRYRGNFGPSHWFRIYSYPMELYGGYPRFQYGGFWFGFMDPWPEYWSDDWYDTDDVYIVYSDDGYYLYNRRYPQDRIAITVYLN